MIDAITVSVYTAHPDREHLGDIPIDTRITAASFETGPGGFGRGRVGLLPPTARYQPATPIGIQGLWFDIPENAHVEMTIGRKILYEGVVTRPLPDRTGFEALGYGPWAGRWTTLDYGSTNRVTSGRVAIEAIRKNPWWNLGEIEDPGIQHAWSEFRYKKAYSILNQLATEGDKTTRWIFTVYEGRRADFRAMRAPADPDLVIEPDPETVDAGPSFDRIDAVRIQYRTPDGAQRMSRWFYRPGVDRTDPYLRRETLYGSGNTNGALAVAQTYLAEHSDLPITGTATYTNHAEIERRAGDPFLLIGYGTGVIESSAHDLYARTTRLALGPPTPDSPQGFIRDLAMTERALKLKLDPTTGAPLANY